MSSHMIDELSAPAFRTTGRFAASGSRPTARCTAFPTSVAATSRSRPASNSTSMELTPKALVDVIVSMPSIPFSSSSMGSVIVASMVSGLAPR